MNEFASNNNELRRLTTEWTPKLFALSEDQITTVRNSQNRCIKQIIGHMVDSASNNTHRMIHLQYQTSPLSFPDYANFGNNDRWIAIQNYQAEDWEVLVNLWKYANLHIAHVIDNLDHSCLDKEWISATNQRVNLREMALDYLSHFKLHLNEITQLINK